MTGLAQQVPVQGRLDGERPPDIVEQVARARARARLRFRIVFALTWILFIGALTALIMATGKVDPQFIGEWLPYILGGVGLTIFVSVTSIALAVGFAVLGALGRLSTIAPIYALASLYVSIVRGTPLIIQIIFVYLALPQFGLSLPPIACGIFALSFNYGAYMTEVFRAGIQAVPRGQVEAAQALGMPQGLIMRRVVLPQAVRIVIPAIGNDFISMIKDSALVNYVTIQEIFWRASTVGTRYFRSFEMLLVAALIYWLLTITFSFFQERLEKRMAESDVRI